MTKVYKIRKVNTDLFYAGWSQGTDIVEPVLKNLEESMEWPHGGPGPWSGLTCLQPFGDFEIVEFDKILTYYEKGIV